MSLAVMLHSLRRLEELPALFESLGLDRQWQAIPVDAWLEDDRLAARVPRAAVVAGAGPLRWFGLEADEPVPVARRVARQLALRGNSAGIAVLGPGLRVLVLAVTIPEPELLVIRLDGPEPAALIAMERLGSLPRNNAAEALARAGEILSTERVGRRFFQQFRLTLESMAAGADRNARQDERRQLALIQLTRILFLYFVQAKGWLDGRPDFLRRQVDACLGRRGHLHRHFLRPLFFGTLNRPTALRDRSSGFGRIPFLNGGLFEPHPLERRYRADFGNAVWRSAFDDLFERFEFTVREGATAGSIAPDMLGRVFEGVMAPEARHASGTYYTPPALVGELLDAAFAALIAGRLGINDVEAARRLRHGDESVREVLQSVTLLDPAVGSGAFLLGALERLAGWQRSARQSSTQLRRQILSRSLFGVDLDPMAVRLTELRLWLAVVAEDEECDPRRVQPLPNLDALIRQGDALRDPVAVIGESLRPSAMAGRLIADLKQRLYPATGETKRDLARALRQAETSAAAEGLQTLERRLEAETAECLASGRDPTLFGSPAGLSRDGRKRLAELRERLRRVRGFRRALERSGTVPWFQFEAHFADVFAAGGGFDIVTGNPPWVRAEQLPPGLRQSLGAQYRWWRGSGRAGFGHQPDLAVAFLERAAGLVAPGGVVALLLPAKLATAEYARTARRALAEQFTIHSSADLTGRAASAFDATVYPMALVASRQAPPPGHEVRDRLDPACLPPLPQAAIAGGGPWVLIGSAQRDAIASMQADRRTVADHFTIQLGVKTGANEVFLDPPDPVEANLIRWAIRGRDVRPFIARGSARLLWTHDARGQPLERLPPRAAAYLDSREATLRARADFAGGPPWALFRTGAALAPHRVVWSDMARRLSAAALTGPLESSRIPLNSCYVLATTSDPVARRLAAWLNCTWIRAVARTGASPARGGYARFDARTVGALPLVDTALTDPALEELSRQGSAGHDIQEALDELCAAHLGLGSRDREALRGLAGRTPHRG
ncbi:MAG: DNA methyltransferase [Gemmatimonadota bacterium]